MTAKEYLSQALTLDKQIKIKKAEIKSYRELSQSISSCRFDEQKFSSSRTEPPYVIFTEKVIDIEREINDLTVRLVTLKFEIGQKIDELDILNERLVLRYKYLMFLSWNEIAAKLNYSKRWTRKIHDDAVLNFSAIMEEGEK